MDSLLLFFSMWSNYFLLMHTKVNYSNGRDVPNHRHLWNDHSCRERDAILYRRSYATFLFQAVETVCFWTGAQTRLKLMLDLATVHSYFCLPQIKKSAWSPAHIDIYQAVRAPFKYRSLWKMAVSLLWGLCYNNGETFTTFVVMLQNVWFRSCQTNVK